MILLRNYLHNFEDILTFSVNVVESFPFKLRMNQCQVCIINVSEIIYRCDILKERP